MTRLALLCRYQDAVTFAAHESACLSMHVANFVALAFAFELWAVTCLALLCGYQGAVTLLRMRACSSMHVVNLVALAAVFELLAVTCLALLCGYQSVVTLAAHESLVVFSCCELYCACICIRALGSDLFDTVVQVPKCCHLCCA